MSFGEALRVWVRVAALSFGGPAAQIAVMHRILVEEKRWVSDHRFFHALNYCMLLPGPEAQQLATYIGWLLHGTRGGVAAGTLFILPGVISIMALSLLYVSLGHVPLVRGAFFGLSAAALALVVEAVLRVGRKALRTRAMGAIAGLSFASLFLLNAPFPLVILVAGLAGLAGGRWLPAQFHVIQLHKSGEGEGGGWAIADDAPAPVAPSWAHATRVLATCLTLWWAPVAMLAAALGTPSVYVQLAVFFSQAAMVTFGGAYSVLAYIAQRAVEVHGWLTPAEMLDGLGMAETTPGPLIMVLQFVGFMGAHREAGGLPPWLAGTLGGLITTWVTFLPCFLWIFLGAPFIERLRGNPPLTAALSAITAAVAGVILNLALWLAMRTLFAQQETLAWGPVRLTLPKWETLNAASLLIGVGAFVALQRYRVGVGRVLAVSVALGMAHDLLHAG